MLTLNLHTHQEHVVPPQDSNSEDATPIVQSNSEVLSSSFSQDSESADFDVSDIMQIDGNASIESIENQNSPLTSSACIRTAPYTLNKEKQLSRLGRNAALNDFDIDVKYKHSMLKWLLPSSGETNHSNTAGTRPICSRCPCILF